MAKPSICSVDACDKPVRARGWCVNHYALWERNGAPVIVRKPAATSCAVEGCTKPPKGKHCSMHGWRKRQHGDPAILKEKPVLPTLCAVDECNNPRAVGKKGWCTSCYQRWRRHGDPTVRVNRPKGEAIKWLHDHIRHQGSDCLIWPFLRHTKGEALIQDRRTRQAARLMCILAHGDPPFNNAQAAHGCGKGHLGCVNPKHLRWATPKENSADKKIHGTLLMGASHPGAKLSEIQVRAIRSLAPNFTISDLAEVFGVHAWTISNVIERKTWACL